jgi:hypothetical protein
MIRAGRDQVGHASTCRVGACLVPSIRHAECQGRGGDITVGCSVTYEGEGLHFLTCVTASPLSLGRHRVVQRSFYQAYFWGACPSSSGRHWLQGEVKKGWSKGVNIFPPDTHSLSHSFLFTSHPLPRQWLLRRDTPEQLPPRPRMPLLWRTSRDTGDVPAGACGSACWPPVVSATSCRPYRPTRLSFAVGHGCAVLGACEVSYKRQVASMWRTDSSRWHSLLPCQLTDRIH